MESSLVTRMLVRLIVSACVFLICFVFPSQHLVNLFARLANDNIGYVDWTPYIPTVSFFFFFFYWNNAIAESGSIRPAEGVFVFCVFRSSPGSCAV